ncbi:MAG: Ferrichrome iron receptor [Nitrospira sp.]|nr:Ferrichrome iron receptor [Nitrospira sp.]
MHGPTMSASSILIGLTVSMLAGCAQLPSEQRISTTEPGVEGACEPPVRERSYVAVCASTMSRQPDTPIRDIPSSTHVITRPVIEDQKALTIGDALRNISGVQGGR